MSASGPVLRARIDGSSVDVEIDGRARIVSIAPADGDSPVRWTTGFTDLHGHGAVGHGYDEADAAGVAAALAYHRAHGTRRALLSLVSAALPSICERLLALRAALPGIEGALGVHLEGPFLAPGRRGAHDATALVAPTPERVERLLEAGEGVLRLVTVAPELPGALNAIDRFVAAGVTVAVGHTEADYEIAAAAFDRGASLVTHALNAMPGLGHREPGPVGAALARDHVVLEAIADGMHVHPVVLAALFAAAPGRVALVSDAMAATGLGDGQHRLGELAVEVRDGRPVLVGTDTLAGSTLTLDRAITTVVDAGVDVDDAIAAATDVPAGAIGSPCPPITIGTAIDTIVATDDRGRRVDPRHAQ